MAEAVLVPLGRAPGTHLGALNAASASAVNPGGPGPAEAAAAVAVFCCVAPWPPGAGNAKGTGEEHDTSMACSVGPAPVPIGFIRFVAIILDFYLCALRREIFELLTTCDTERKHPTRRPQMTHPRNPKTKPTQPSNEGRQEPPTTIIMISSEREVNDVLH